VNIPDKREILIVDDDIEFRHSLEKTLLKAGYLVTTAEDGMEASKLFATHQYPLILLDMHMPGKSGLAVLTEIKKRWPDTRVIVISVNGSMETYTDVMNLGAFAYLSKPVKMKKVLSYASLALSDA